MEATITYEFLYDILRREKDRTELQKLEDSFYEKTINYMEEKKTNIEITRRKRKYFYRT